MIIIDELLSPFSIEVDESQYSVIETRIAKEGSKSAGYEKSKGHFKLLENALREIGKQQVLLGNPDGKLTLKEYIDKIEQNYKILTDKIKL